MKIIYSENAVADLIRLREFIESKNPDAATRIGEELVKRIENLQLFPQMGHAVDLAPEPDSIRDMTFGDHIVRYVPREELIIVLRVWHHFEGR